MIESHGTHIISSKELPNGKPTALILDLLNAARRRLVPLLAWILLCLSVGLAYILNTPSSFTATTTIILDPRRAVGGINSDTSNSASLPALDSAQAESQIQVIKSERLLSTVFNSLNLIDSPEFATPRDGRLSGLTKYFMRPSDDDATPLKAAARYTSTFLRFSDRVTARRIGQSYAIEVSYSSPSAAQASKLANAIVSAYLLQQLSFKLAAAQNGAEYLQGRINSLSNQVKIATDAMNHGLTPSSLLPDADARIISSAYEPVSRSAPKPMLVLTFSLSLGIFSGLFMISIFAAFDKKVYTAIQLETITGLATLATLQDISKRRVGYKRPTTDSYLHTKYFPESRFSFSIRGLRTSVLLRLGKDEGISCGLVGTTPSTASAVVAANLAFALSDLGMKALLLDSDFEERNPPFSDLVSDDVASLQDYLSDHGGGLEAGVGIARDPLLIIPARRSSSPHKHDLYLGSRKMRELVCRWQSFGALVANLPAAGITVDGRALASMLDGVILIVESGRTNSDDVIRAIASLADSRANIVGAVLVE